MFDFEGLNARLLPNAEALVSAWLPGGKREGREWKCADLGGKRGHSFSVNLSTGKWAEFNGSENGGSGHDLTGLYACVHRVSQGDAYTALGGEGKAQQQQPVTGPPPPNAPVPGCGHSRHGKPSAVWCYRGEDGSVLFYVARYETKSGKEIVPWSWQADKQAWAPRGLPTPRPLYGLWKLPEAPSAPVLIVEGEKAAEAAQRLCGPSMLVLTWSGGALGSRATDWTPLAGRKVTLWPDADRKSHEGSILPAEKQPGMMAMCRIAELLKGVASSARILDVGIPAEDTGWDAADAEAEGWDWTRVLAWARPIARDAFAVPTLAVATPTEISHFSRWESLGLALTKGGQPMLNVDNIERFLAGEKAPIWLDTFSDRVRTEWDFQNNAACKASDWRDSNALALLVYLQRHMGLPKLGLDAVVHGVEAYAARNQRNEPREWMERLVWDRTPRLADMMPHIFKTSDTEYNRDVGANWIKSIVARVLMPGCKADNMVVLVGGQGARKSTALEIIGGDWYSLSYEKVEARSFLLGIKGKMICEIAELEAFKKSDVDSVKRMLSTRVDRYDNKYARYAEDTPRTCIFTGTTNQIEFLADATGARRFEPATVGNIDVDKLRLDREQIFAEAVHRVRAGETWHVRNEASARREQSKHRVGDVWDETVATWIEGQTDLTIAQIATDALDITLARQDAQVSRRIGYILRSNGWTSSVSTINGCSVRVWNKTEAAN